MTHTVQTYTVRMLEEDGAHDLTGHIVPGTLSFKSIDPGGYADVQFDLFREVDADNFDKFADIAVFDDGTGEQVGGGRLLQPGRGVDEHGEGVWKCAALGEGIAHAQERKKPYFLIDRQLETWKNGSSTSKNREWSVQTRPRAIGLANDDDRIALVLTISQSSIGEFAYSNADFYDMRQYPDTYLGGAHWTYQMGHAESVLQLEGQVREPDGTTTDLVSNNWTQSEILRQREIGTHWTATLYDRMNFVFSHPFSGTFNFDSGFTAADYWIAIYDYHIAALRKNRQRQDIISNADPEWGTGYITDTVETIQVVIDCVARYCPRFDLENARVDDNPFSTYAHEVLAWPDGVTAYEVFEYLMSFDPEFTWAVWEKKQNGLYNFEWRLRDSDVRYEFGDGAEIGYELTGGEEKELATVYVFGQDERDRYKVREVFGTNPFAALDIDPTDTIPINQQGLNKYEWNSSADQLAEGAITDSKFFATSAQVVIGDHHDVYDHHTGRWITSDKVLPGYLCRILNIRSQNDALNNPDEDDDSGIFRIVSNSRSTSDQRSTIELNSYTLTEMQAISRLLRRSGGR